MANNYTFFWYKQDFAFGFGSNPSKEFEITTLKPQKYDDYESH